MRRFNHIRYGKILAMMFVLVSYTAVTTSVYLYSQFGNELGLNHVLQFTSAKPAKTDDPKVAIIDIRIGSARAGGSVPLSPSIINIHKGDTVMWVNNDNVTHSLKALSFNSNVIWPQGHRPSTFNYTFNDAGTFVYVDSLHPYLGGVIYVDIPTTQREIISTTASFVNVKIEMPQNAAYKNNYGGFFIPASIQAPVGTKLTWSNKDYVAHTATSSDGSAFDTRTILPGTSLTLTIHHKGVFPYYCKIHPWMMGTVIVS